jgi:hypothetical protein
MFARETYVPPTPSRRVDGREEVDLMGIGMALDEH